MIIRGPTGCAKTRILQRLKKVGVNTIDLEGIAKHKGSLLGSNPNMSQPSQKLFESQIYLMFVHLFFQIVFFHIFY